MDDLELLEEFSEYLRTKKEEGKQIIAFMAHDNVPEELIMAANCIPLRMVFSGNDDLMDESHNYLPPSTCSFAQSCIGLFSRKPNVYSFLENIDYFLVSNHCVSDICASEIISKYFFIPRLNFYSSYTQNDNALKYFKAELLDLKQQLEKVKGSSISDQDILNNIKKYNNLKNKLLQVNDLKIKGSVKLKIFQRAMLFGLDSLLHVERVLKKKNELQQQYSNNAKDILLTGCSIFIGDFLIDLIEDCGGNVVFFDTWIGHSYFSQRIPKKDLEFSTDPLDLLVQRFKNNIYGDHSVPNFLNTRINLIQNYFEQYQKENGKKLGIINHIIKFCDHISMFQTDLKQVLQEKGIQVLNLERDYSKSIRGQLSTRIEAFLEMI
ncbi:MAG: 2-hydroxyacyl-CoA dehydratase subunit D [Promethearchaeota archaeon]